MTSLLFASALLAAQLAAAPVDAAPPAKRDAPAAAPAAPAPAAKPAPKQEPASAASLKDARQALLGPCSPEMAGGKVTAIEVVDGVGLNALLEKEKSTKPNADPYQRFMLVSYTAGATTGKSTRQVSTQYLLTTEQAKVLVGEKLCVFKE
jgi:hypothetical protein